jgi:N-acetylneuraminate lyase
MPKELKGVIPAVCTPYDADGEIDLGKLEELIELLIADGGDGLYMTGGTGESMMLDQSERMALCETAVKAANGRVPVIVHVGGMREKEATALAIHAEKAGADGVSAFPPIFYPRTAESIIGYYTRLAGATQLPFFSYHLPVLGADVPVEVILKFAEIPGVAGMKFSDFDLGVFMRIRRELGPDFIIFSGNDEIAFAAFQLGADGIIGLNYTFQCSMFKGMHEALQRGDLDRALQLQTDGIAITEAFRGPALIDGAKAILKYRGLDVGRARPPLPRQSDEQIESLYRWLDGFEFKSKLASAREA